MLDIRNPLAPTIVGSGLIITVGSGVLINSTNQPVTVAKTVVTLTPSASNFVFVDANGNVSVNTSGFLANTLPIATVTTNGNSVTGVLDNRPDFYVPGSGGSTAPSLFFGATSVPLTGARIVPNLSTFAIASGTTDLYTVPAGKKALLVECTFTNPTGNPSSITCFSQYKISGVYTSFDFISNAATAGSLGVAALLAPMLFNAGETFAVNTNNSGLSLWPFIVEFDASVPVSVARLNTFIAGDNTLLTAPSGGVQFYTNITGIGAGTPTKGTLFYFNNTGIARTIGWNVVPSGNSPANANQIASGVSVSSSPAISTRTFYGGMNTGDFISVNSDSNSAGQSAHVIYRTLP